jgi:hypothetical protein
MLLAQQTPAAALAAAAPALLALLGPFVSDVRDEVDSAAFAALAAAHAVVASLALSMSTPDQVAAALVRGFFAAAPDSLSLPPPGSPVAALVRARAIVATASMDVLAAVCLCPTCVTRGDASSLLTGHVLPSLSAPLALPDVPARALLLGLASLSALASAPEPPAGLAVELVAVAVTALDHPIDVVRGDAAGLLRAALPRVDDVGCQSLLRRAAAQPWHVKSRYLLVEALLRRVGFDAVIAGVPTLAADLHACLTVSNLAQPAGAVLAALFDAARTQWLAASPADARADETALAQRWAAVFLPALAAILLGNDQRAKTAAAHY